MIRSALLLPLVLFGACAEPAQWRGLGRLDETRAFYYPRFGRETEHELAAVAGRSIDAATYFRYLAGRFGTRYVEDLAFDIALERECAARGLARSAPVLARSMAAMRSRAFLPLRRTTMLNSASNRTTSGTAVAKKCGLSVGVTKTCAASAAIGAA